MSSPRRDENEKALALFEIDLLMNLYLDEPSLFSDRKLPEILHTLQETLSRPPIDPATLRQCKQELTTIKNHLLSDTELRLATVEDAKTRELLGIAKQALDKAYSFEKKATPILSPFKKNMQKMAEAIKSLSQMHQQDPRLAEAKAKRSDQLKYLHERMSIEAAVYDKVFLRMKYPQYDSYRTYCKKFDDNFYDFHLSDEQYIKKMDEFKNTLIDIQDNITTSCAQFVLVAKSNETKIITGMNFISSLLAIKDNKIKDNKKVDPHENNTKFNIERKKYASDLETLFLNDLPKHKLYKSITLNLDNPKISDQNFDRACHQLRLLLIEKYNSYRDKIGAYHAMSAENTRTDAMKYLETALSEPDNKKYESLLNRFANEYLHLSTLSEQVTNKQNQTTQNTEHLGASAHSFALNSLQTPNMQPSVRLAVPLSAYSQAFLHHKGHDAKLKDLPLDQVDYLKDLANCLRKKQYDNAAKILEQVSHDIRQHLGQYLPANLASNLKEAMHENRDFKHNASAPQSREDRLKSDLTTFIEQGELESAAEYLNMLPDHIVRNLTGYLPRHLEPHIHKAMEFEPFANEVNGRARNSSEKK